VLEIAAPARERASFAGPGGEALQRVRHEPDGEARLPERMLQHLCQLHRHDDRLGMSTPEPVQERRGLPRLAAAAQQAGAPKAGAQPHGPLPAHRRVFRQRALRLAPGLEELAERQAILRVQRRPGGSAEVVTQQRQDIDERAEICPIVPQRRFEMPGITVRKVSEVERRHHPAGRIVSPRAPEDGSLDECQRAALQPPAEQAADRVEQIQMRRRRPGAILPGQDEPALEQRNVEPLAVVRDNGAGPPQPGRQGPQQGGLLTKVTDQELLDLEHSGLDARDPHEERHAAGAGREPGGLAVEECRAGPVQLLHRLLARE